jgi:hypothetical protein
LSSFANGRRRFCPSRPSCPYGEFSADDGLDPGSAGGLVKTRRAVDAASIEKRERLVPELRGAVDEQFRKRCALQKAERRCGMKLDVIGR